MQLWQALILGALQGVSELFPVSSLGHTILIPALLGWNLNEAGGDFLAFVVALHLATAIALFIYFWQSWREVLLALVGSVQRRQLVYDPKSKLAWLLVAGTILVGLFGLAFEKPLRQLFDDPKTSWVVAGLLVVNGGLMLYGDYLRKQTEFKVKQATMIAPFSQTSGAYDAALTGIATATAQGPATRSLKEVEELNFVQATGIGATQILALFPGISRSGVTMVAGLWAGLTYEAAARFGFMLATPVIGLAALLKVPELFKPEAKNILGMTVLAAIVAGLTAYLSIRFLMRYFETRRLSPFAYYCIGAGLLSLLVILGRG
jgi:undecaprenyl-diphosphatase